MPLFAAKGKGEEKGRENSKAEKREGRKEREERGRNTPLNKFMVTALIRAVAFVSLSVFVLFHVMKSFNL